MQQLSLHYTVQFCRQAERSYNLFPTRKIFCFYFFYVRSRLCRIALFMRIYLATFAKQASLNDKLRSNVSFNNFLRLISIELSFSSNRLNFHLIGDALPYNFGYVDAKVFVLLSKF